MFMLNCLEVVSDFSEEAYVSAWIPISGAPDDVFRVIWSEQTGMASKTPILNFFIRL